MRCLIDAREYDSLNPSSPAIYGASEPLVLRVAKALTDAGHRVDGIWKGDHEQYVDGVVWWPYHTHPTKCDVLISCEWLIHAHEFDFKRLYVPLNKNNPILSGMEEQVDGFILFTEEHKRQFLLYNNTVKEEQCIIIPVGVDAVPKAPKVPNRVIWCHTPERGLFHIARQWPEILKYVPDATLAITYGVERSWETNKWLMDVIAELLLEDRRFMERHKDSIIDLGRATPAAVRKAQQEAEVMSYPCDAPLPGIVTSFAVMECAAAGNALILPELEGLPEEFGGIAQMMTIPIIERDWVEATAEILLDEERKLKMAKAGRAWAKTRPWSKHEKMWADLVAERSVVTA